MSRRTAAALVIGAVVAAAVGGWWAGRTIRSPAEEAARTVAPEPSPILVPAERRVLAANIVTRGTARFGEPVDVVLPASGLKGAPRVATRLPAPGDILAEGDVGLMVAGRPVFVLLGAVPSYRDLGPGTRGDDVRQLEEALGRLGFDPGDEDGVFDTDTATAVAAWYLEHGHQPLRAGEEQLAEINPPEGELAEGLAPEPGLQVPADEVLFLPRLPVRVSEPGVALGEQLDGPVLTVTSTQVAIDTSVSLDEAALVAPGMTAAVDEADLGIDATGVVGFVADAPGTNDVGASQLYMEVVVGDAPPAIIGASVRVTIAIESTGGEVLAVPLGAVTLAADGSSRVQRDASGALEFVTVEPGLAAAGMVEVTPLDGTLEEGDLVVVGFETPQPDG